MLTKWLKDSGLVVNAEKTEICLFLKRDHPTVNLTINGKLIKSKKNINVLGVTFNSKLQWSSQVSQAINNSKRALHGIRLIKKFLTKQEIKGCFTCSLLVQIILCSVFASFSVIKGKKRRKRYMFV